jgi:hypothetical protein
MATAREGMISGGGRAREIAELWRAVLARPPHPAGCTCMGHFLIPAMNPSDLESDILDYMRARYEAEGISSLVRLLDERQRQQQSGAPAPFRAWLLSLPEQNVRTSALDRFLTDLHATLASFAPDIGPAVSRTSRFVCD